MVGLCQQQRLNHLLHVSVPHSQYLNTNKQGGLVTWADFRRRATHFLICEATNIIRSLFFQTLATLWTLWCNYTHECGDTDTETACQGYGHDVCGNFYYDVAWNCEVQTGICFTLKPAHVYLKNAQVMEHAKFNQKSYHLYKPSL